MTADRVKESIRHHFSKVVAFKEQNVVDGVLFQIAVNTLMLSESQE